MWVASRFFSIDNLNLLYAESKNAINMLFAESM